MGGAGAGARHDDDDRGRRSSRKSTFPARRSRFRTATRKRQLFQTGPAMPNLNGVDGSARRAELERPRRVAGKPTAMIALPLSLRFVRGPCRGRRAETLDELLGQPRARERRPPDRRGVRRGGRRRGADRAAARDRGRADETRARAADEPADPDDARRGWHDEHAVDAADARERAAARWSAGGLLRSAVGIGSAAPSVDAEQTQREMEQAMAEPWVRGIGAARALAGARRRRGCRAFLCRLLADAARATGRRRRASRTSSAWAAPRRGAADLDARQRGRVVVVIGVAVARRVSLTPMTR